MIAAALFFSCEKDTPEKEQMVEAEVEFGISHILPDGTKNLPLDPLDDPPTCPDDMDPVRAHIEIDGFQDPFKPLVFEVDGKLYTQSIKFYIDPNQEQDFTITKFFIENASGEIIMATPNEGSDYAEYIDDDYHLPFDFTVDAFMKTEIGIEVLCFVPDDFDKFGFNWFEIGQFIVREYNFYGDFCIKDAAQYANSSYASQTGFPASGFIDAPAIFEIHVFEKDAPEDADPLKTFTNEVEDWYGVGAPLEIDVLMEYGKEYRLELHLLVSTNNAFEFVHIYTFYADTEMAQVPLTNIEGVPYDITHEVLDFVVGGCVYGDPDLQLPPWQSLPEKASITINHNADYSHGAYWKLTVNSVDNTAPAGTYDFPSGDDLPKDIAGWCGDHATTITEGTNTFYVYSSYWDFNWPPMPVDDDGDEIINLEKLAAVNWLMNNLNLFGITMPTGMFIEPEFFSTQEAKDIQDAIWLIINESVHHTSDGPSANATNMRTQALQNKDFIPLPGGYAAVLLARDGVPKTHQLIFTIVDP